MPDGSPRHQGPGTAIPGPESVLPTSAPAYCGGGGVEAGAGAEAGAGGWAGAGVCAAGAVGVPLASGADASGFLLLSAYRVLSVATVLAFFFFVPVSPFKPSGVDCACRSATSAASGAGGVSLLVCPPFAPGVFGVLARAL